MKTLTILLVCTVLAVQVSGYLIKVPTEPIAAPTISDNSQWVHIQKLMIPLFENVCETSNNPIIRRLAQEFSFDSTEYLNEEVMSELQKLVSTGLLPKGKIFSEYDSDHLKELKVIYEVLYKAKNFDAFYKAAAWARQNVNCGLYVNALYLAIQNRRDTERLSIPAPYELLPNYFIIKDAIVKASSILSGAETSVSESVRFEGNTYTIDANYTAMFYDNEDDSKLAYFCEDVGLNSYYFLRKLRMAPWFNNDVNGSFGENMYQMMKQFMARYNLERYANGLPEIDSIDWNSLPDIPYDPMLIYSDGNEFSHRKTSLNLPDNEDLVMLQTIESNIVAVVSHMRQSGYTKQQILNHLMEILVTGERSYENLARQLLGKDQTNNGQGSVLDHYLTSLRDPMFWKINKNIVDMVDEALKIVPTYTRNELYFPGVEVLNVDVKKMVTACDYFQFDVTDALKVNENNSTFKIKIGQPRLNHKPFTIKLNISSLVSQKGLVKIYLGPKLLPGELAIKKNLFTLLDVFETNLKIGSNIITRSSDNMKHFSEDFMLLNTIRKKVEDAEFGLDSLPLKSIQAQVGYPSRLILPKGSPQGLPLQIFVFVAPYFKVSIAGNSYTRNTMEFNTAILSPGYPLDLMIGDHQLFELPNAMVKYISVSQKSDSKVENYGGPGITKTWYGKDTYDPSSRPNYNSNKGQYGGKYDYASKVNEYNTGNDNIVLEGGSDDYDVIGLDSTHNLLQGPNFDYTSKRKENEPFDYKAKKAQYDRKNFPKRDYSQYRTKAKTDTDTVISTTIFDILDTTEKLDHMLEEHDIPNSEVSAVRDFLEVEPLPLAAMLKKEPEKDEKFDYKPIKTEREYIIKEKKIALDNLIKDAKRKSRPDKVKTTTENAMLSNENTEKVILSKDFINFDDLTFENNELKSDDLKEKPRKFDFEKRDSFPKKDKTNTEIKRNDYEETVMKVHLNKDNKKFDFKNHDTKPLNEIKANSDIKNTGAMDNNNVSDEIDSQFSFESNKKIAKDNNQEESEADIHTDIERSDSDDDSIYLLEVEKKHNPTLYDYILRTLGGQFRQ